MGKIAGIEHLINQVTNAVTNPLSIAEGVAGKLIENTLGPITSQVSSFAGGLINTVVSSALPESLASSLTGSLSMLSSQVANYAQHTNILSGIVTDISSYSQNLMTMQQIANMAGSLPGIANVIDGKTPVTSDIAATINGLGFSNVLQDVNGVTSFNPSSAMASLGASSMIHGPALFGDLSDSLNPAMPGGLSGLVDSIIAETNRGQQIRMTGDFVSQVTVYHNTMVKHIADDISNQNRLQISAGAVAGIGSFLPDTTNSLSQLTFDSTGTSLLKTINEQVQSAGNLQSEVPL